MKDKLKLLARVLALLFTDEVRQGRTVGVWTFNGDETCSEYRISVRVEVMSRELKNVDGQTIIFTG